MKSNNICKFPSSDTSNALSISCFVLETDQEIMQQPVRLNANRMILIEQGSGELSFDGTPFAVSTGTLIFGFEGESFALRAGKDVRYLYIDFQGNRGEHLCHRFGISRNTRRKDNFNALIPFCKESLLNTQPKNIDITAECVLLYVFSRLSSERDASQSDIIQKVIQHTEENFRDPDFSISDVARAIGYNSKYLSHLFKKSMDVNYCEYLRSMRLRYAVSLFELGLSSVKNVAMLSGFSDPLYFSNTFKKTVGISPKEFIAKRAEQSE